MHERSPEAYPAWWHERAKTRRRQLDRAVERLRTVIGESSDFVGALVFGSYARDAVGPESDLDIVLVTTLPANGDPGGRYAHIIQRLALGVRCDLIVFEPEAFGEARERPFVAHALSEGIWIGAAAPR